MRRTLIYLAGIVFVGVLLVSWLTHGTASSERPRPQHLIPERLDHAVAGHGRLQRPRHVLPLSLASARSPDLSRHDEVRGRQVGPLRASVPGPQPQGIYEDRVTMMVDDGSVPEFARYGGYITIGDGMRFFTDEAEADEVEAHPYLGQKRRPGRGRKYLPATRRTSATGVRRSGGGTGRAAQAGYFLDLWHWRAHRSNPIACLRRPVIFDARSGDAGAALHRQLGRAKRSSRVHARSGEDQGRALKWDDVASASSASTMSTICEDTAVPFDAAPRGRKATPFRAAPAQGDGLACRHHGRGRGAGKDGFWDVTLKRAMDTGHPLDDKILVDKGVYNVAFAVHRDALGSRWHNVSLPVTLGLGREADLVAAASTARRLPGTRSGTRSRCSIPARSAGRCSTAPAMPAPNRSQEGRAGQVPPQRSSSPTTASRRSSPTRSAANGCSRCRRRAAHFAFGIALNGLLKRRKGV
jgi:hypothetical protein